MSTYSSYPPRFSFSNGESWTVATKERNLDLLVPHDDTVTCENLSEWIIEVKYIKTDRVSHYLIRCVNDEDDTREIIWLPVSTEFCEDHLFI